MQTLADMRGVGVKNRGNYADVLCGLLLSLSGRVQETLPESIESGPLCITDLFQNESVAFFKFIITFFMLK